MEFDDKHKKNMFLREDARIACMYLHNDACKYLSDFCTALTVVLTAARNVSENPIKHQETVVRKEEKQEFYDSPVFLIRDK